MFLLEKYNVILFSVLGIKISLIQQFRFIQFFYFEEYGRKKEGKKKERKKKKCAKERNK